MQLLNYYWRDQQGAGRNKTNFVLPAQEQLRQQRGVSAYLEHDHQNSAERCFPKAVRDNGLKPEILQVQNVLGTIEQDSSELNQRQVFVYILFFWKLLFCLALSQTKSQLVIEDSYFVIDCREELYSYIPFDSISVQNLCLKNVKVYKEIQQDNSSLVFDQNVVEPDDEGVQVQAYVLFCLLKNAKYLSSLVEIIFAGITNVDITDFTHLVWRENDSVGRTRIRIVYQFIEVNFSSKLSFALFNRKDYHKGKVLPLLAKMQTDDDNKVDESQQIVDMNQSSIRKKEYKYEFNGTKSINQFLETVDQIAPSNRPSTIELVWVDSKIQYNCSH
eukprot:CAMPEP_0168339254 /NCGR_PEP_ID=MMETSP0213-20121227/13350_1 /TAXON_ID=151035 /ORGANISM="Euplotes harpa, Strain FSP1.4" /LENGTH=330 /DNA_ID=CAMNT_0008345247 /DNA_START=524 /DNA_END=1518 /DNA_ORIENTATION=+